MQTMVIENETDLLQYLALVIENRESSFTPQFSDNFNLQIKLSGSQWKGKLNYQFANFVIRLQNEILNTYNLCHGTNHNTKSLRVLTDIVLTVSVEQGCSFWDAKISELLNSITKGFSSMESKDKRRVLIWLISCTSIAFLGIYGIGGYVDYLKSIELSKVNQERDSDSEKTKQMLIELFAETQQINEQSEASYMSYAASQLHPDDTLTTKNRTYTRDEAIKQFSGKKEAENIIIDTFYLDGVYRIPSAYFEAGAIDIAISKRKPFKALTASLAKADKDTLYDAYKKADSQGAIAELQLQVTAYIVNGKIDSAMIVGLGKSRDNSIRIDDAIQEMNKKRLTKNQSQNSLLDIQNSPIPTQN